jgi:hypothetical protein
MDEKQKQYEKNRKHSEALNFRVDKKTYMELTLIAEQRGMSRSDVCRERLKGLKYEPPLFSKEDTKTIVNGLNALGNNLNQATKNLNIISKHFQQRTNSKPKNMFSYDSGYDIFQDEIANKVAKELLIKNPDNIFTEGNRQNYKFDRLDEESKQYFDHWTRKNSRPLTKEEYAHRINKGLLHSLQILSKLEEDSEKLWALV